MSHSSLTVDSISCSTCGTSLLKPEVNYPPTACVQCSTCTQFFCKKHFPTLSNESNQSNTNSKQNDSKESGSKQSDTSSNLQTIKQRWEYDNVEDISSPLTEEEQPFDTLDCPICKKQTLFKRLFENVIFKSCKRCKSTWFESNSKCLNHSGKHELPLDEKKCPTFGNVCCDIGGQYSISTIRPLLLPGRWTCCGRICYHNHPTCPYYNEYTPTPFKIVFNDEEDPSGCTPCNHHTMESKCFPDSKPTYNVPDKTVTTGEILNAQTGEIRLENPWNAKVNWNTNKPYIWEISKQRVPDEIVNAANESVTKGTWIG